jgi:hypothetical protein
VPGTVLAAKLRLLLRRERAQGHRSEELEAATIKRDGLLELTEVVEAVPEVLEASGDVQGVAEGIFECERALVEVDGLFELAEESVAVAEAFEA